ANKAYLLQNARCLVAPSRTWEAFPLVLLEAAACGVPVIASRLAGMQEIVEENGLGRLVPPEDVSALRGAVTDVFQVSPSPEERSGLRQSAARFSWTAVAEQHIALFEELLRAARAA